VLFPVITRSAFGRVFICIPFIPFELNGLRTLSGGLE